MSSELLVSRTGAETRVAHQDGGQVVGLYVERDADRGVVGNVYKGRVVRVLPGMQAAFVDVGLDRAAFLYVNDVFVEGGPPATSGRDALPEAAPPPPGGPAAAGGEDIEDAEDEDEDDTVADGEGVLTSSAGTGATRPPARPILEILSEGQEVLVQVAKDPMGTKGARLTGYVALPGRYVVLMPRVEHVGVSRKIEDPAERGRLRSFAEAARPPGMGIIVRTVCEGMDTAALQADMDYLLRLWSAIQERWQKERAPALLHRDLDLALRAVRDLFTENVRRLVVDDERTHASILRFTQDFMPALAARIEVHDGRSPVFEARGVEVELARALNRRVWLKSGGYIVIDRTEALTAIDVNSGKYVGGRNLEETTVRVNLEAVPEIVHQLRLRDIGGIIIIDFIDMDRPESRDKVYGALLDALKADRARTNVLRISEFGLVEMTRKRVREDLVKYLTEACRYCEGRGFTRSRTTVCYDIFREVVRKGAREEVREVEVLCHPDVADLLYDQERRSLEELRTRLRRPVHVRALAYYHVEQFEVRVSVT
ncbi:Rne/Rng family ribonuclease [Myxococcota bacterium]|nr:Rne/Rng family ribonuclease [Myxococcota bacterium]